MISTQLLSAIAASIVIIFHMSNKTVASGTLDKNHLIPATSGINVSIFTDYQEDISSPQLITYGAVIKDIVPRIIDDERHYFLDRKLVINKLITESAF